MGRVRIMSIIGAMLVAVVVALLVHIGRAHLAYMDPIKVFAPMFVLAASLLGLVLFWVRVAFADQAVGGRGWRRFFSPAFPVIRETLADRSYKIVMLVAATIYALIFFFAEGVISKDPIGPNAEILWNGVPGFMPQLTLFPLHGLGVRLSAYQTATILFLATLFGINVAMLVRLFAMQGKLIFKGRGLAPGLGGAATGLLISCPSCAATPLVAVVSAFLVPAGTLMQKAVGSIVIFMISALLVYLGLSISSQAVKEGQYCRLP